jgi:hypothetical protein
VKLGLLSYECPISLGKRLGRKLFIHAGPAKTGTSAIQHILREHDNSVVIYPKVGLWADGSHHNLVLNFYEEYRRPEMMRCDTELLLAQIAEETAKSDLAVVISSEILAGRNDVERFIRALMPLVNCAPEDVEILLLCREHFERAASLYNQRVKDAVTSETRGPDKFLTAQVRNLRYAPMLRRLDKSGFRVTALNYHPAGDCVPRFLRHIGFSDAQLPAARARNVSLSTKGLVATLAANRAARTSGERQRFSEALKAMRGMFAPSRFIFGRDAAVAADAIFDEDRRFLRDRLNLTLPAPDIATQECTFFLTGGELDDVASAVQGIGDAGDTIVEIARRHVRVD